MKNSKNLSRDHIYILSLLAYGPMDTHTLASASFGTKKRIKGIIADLLDQNLVERLWKNGGYLYKKV